MAALPWLAETRAVFVSGNSTFSDCGLSGSDYAILLTGDLEGCWSTFVQSFTCKELEHYDLYLEEGREVFVGKFRTEAEGRFRTTYTFDGAYAKGFCRCFDCKPGGRWRLPSRSHRRSHVFEDAEGLIEFIM